MTGKTKRAESIFLATRDLTPSQRAAVLEEECEGDDKLRAEVEILLRRQDARASAGSDQIGRASCRERV